MSLFGRNVQRNVVLAGFHAAGKTTVGKLLARRLRRTLLDSRQELKRRQRYPLRVLLPIGAAPESDLQQAEQFLLDFTYRRECVLELDVALALSCAPCELLGEFSFIVFLDPPFETLLARMAAESRYAPLLEDGPAALRLRWEALRERFADCDLRLQGEWPARTSQYILHSYFT